VNVNSKLFFMHESVARMSNFTANRASEAWQELGRVIIIAAAQRSSLTPLATRCNHST
jgi:hypothetical protein